MGKSRLSVRSMALTAVMSALLCIAAPFSVPMPSAVPLSLATLAVYLTGALLGKRKGTAAVCLYVMIGLVGLPVFSGFMGGFAVIAGATGGYILGYIPCAFLTGLLTEFSGGKLRGMAAGMVLGTLVLYLFGTVWFILFTDSEAGTAIVGCVLPFLPLDTLKIVAACALSLPLRDRLLSVEKGR